MILSHVLRRFEPVGHGGFCHEDFYTRRHSSDERGEHPCFTAVYDCGSLKKALAENAVERAFTENQRVDAVYISHLHEDHTSGLEFLLRRCSVTNLYLPFFAPKYRPLFLLGYLAGGGEEGSFTYRLLDDPLSALNEIGKEINVYFVLPTPEEGTEPEGDPNSDRDDDDPLRDSTKKGKVFIRRIPSGCNTLSELPDKQPFFASDKYEDFFWCFVPHNFCYEEKLEALRAKLEEKGIPVPVSSMTGTQVGELWKDRKDEIKGVYRDAKAFRNENSMVLYSGPTLSYKYLRWQQLCVPRRALGCQAGRMGGYGCLHFGDYEAQDRENWEAIQEKYGEYFDAVDVVQLPHHGSDRNFREELLTGIDAKYYVAACRSGDSKHPGKSVKDAFDKAEHANRKLIAMTEHSVAAVFRNGFCPMCEDCFHLQEYIVHRRGM